MSLSLGAQTRPLEGALKPVQAYTLLSRFSSEISIGVLIVLSLGLLISARHFTSTRVPCPHGAP